MILTAIDNTTKVEFIINAHLSDVEAVLPLLARTMVDTGENDLAKIKSNLTRRLQFLYKKYLEGQREESINAFRTAAAESIDDFSIITANELDAKLQNDVILSSNL